MKRRSSSSRIVLAAAALALVAAVAAQPAVALQFPRCSTLQGTSCSTYGQTTNCQDFVANSGGTVQTYTCKCDNPYVNDPGRPYAWHCSNFPLHQSTVGHPGKPASVCR